MNLPEMPSMSSPPSGELGAHYLSRLARLLRIRCELDDDLNTLGVHLIERAIAATVKDCVESGAGRAAQTLLAGIRGPRKDALP